MKGLITNAQQICTYTKCSVYTIRHSNAFKMCLIKLNTTNWSYITYK